MGEDSPGMTKRTCVLFGLFSCLVFFTLIGLVAQAAEASCEGNSDWNWALSKFEFRGFKDNKPCSPSDEFKILLADLVSLKNLDLSVWNTSEARLLQQKLGRFPIEFLTRYVRVIHFAPDAIKCTEQAGRPDTAMQAFVLFSPQTQDTVFLCKRYFTSSLEFPGLLLHEAEHLRTREDHVPCDGSQDKNAQLPNCDRSVSDIGPYGIQYNLSLLFLRSDKISPLAKIGLRSTVMGLASFNFQEKIPYPTKEGILIRRQSGRLFFATGKGSIEIPIDPTSNGLFVDGGRIFTQISDQAPQAIFPRSKLMEIEPFYQNALWGEARHRIRYRISAIAKPAIGSEGERPGDVRPGDQEAGKQLQLQFRFQCRSGHTWHEGKPIDNVKFAGFTSLSDGSYQIEVHTHASQVTSIACLGGKVAITSSETYEGSYNFGIRYSQTGFMYLINEKGALQYMELLSKNPELKTLSPPNDTDSWEADPILAFLPWTWHQVTDGILADLE